MTTLKDIAEKALAKAGEVLDNPGNWTGANTSKLSADAVATLVNIGVYYDHPPACSLPPLEELTQVDPVPVEDKPKRAKKAEKEEPEPAAA